MTRDKKKSGRDIIYILELIVLGIILAAVIIFAGTKHKATVELSPVIPEPSISASPEIEKIVVVTPSPSEVPEPRYGFTDEEIYLLAQLLCGSKDVSGDGEYDIDFKKEINYYEVSKVLCVVMNRVRSDAFPDTVYDVVLQTDPRQFSVMPANSNKIPSDMALKVVREWCKAYDCFDPGAQVVPEDHLYFTGNGKINITR